MLRGDRVCAPWSEGPESSIQRKPFVDGRVMVSIAPRRNETKACSRASPGRYDKVAERADAIGQDWSLRRIAARPAAAQRRIATGSQIEHDIAHGAPVRARGVRQKRPAARSGMRLDGAPPPNRASEIALRSRARREDHVDDVLDDLRALCRSRTAARAPWATRFGRLPRLDEALQQFEKGAASTPRSRCARPPRCDRRWSAAQGSAPACSD